MARKKISTTIYLAPEQLEALQKFSAQTRVPLAEYVRSGVDMVLAKLRDGASPWR